LRIGPGLQQQCDWDATAVTVHVFWVSRVFNNNNNKLIFSASRWSEASIVMSLLQQIPEKYHDHDDVHIKLAQCTARKESKHLES
jgi:hypothetical protein